LGEHTAICASTKLLLYLPENYRGQKHVDTD
jgi:hypothetical protein